MLADLLPSPPELLIITRDHANSAIYYWDSSGAQAHSVTPLVSMVAERLDAPRQRAPQFQADSSQQPGDAAVCYFDWPFLEQPRQAFGVCISRSGPSALVAGIVPSDVDLQQYLESLAQPLAISGELVLRQIYTALDQQRLSQQVRDLQRQQRSVASQPASVPSSFDSAQPPSHAQSHEGPTQLPHRQEPGVTPPRDELLEEIQRAQAASRAKSEFLASMSHEIRTPMTAIIGFADLLYSEGEIHRAPRHRLRAIESIRRNGVHLLEIINDILDLSKIEAGRLDIEQLSCSPGEILTEVIELMQHRAEQKQLCLLIDDQTFLPCVIQTDPTRLRQILVNLIGNAIKFTEQGEVRVHGRLDTSAEHPRLEISVTDTGVGITPAQMARLFHPFSQAEASTARRYGGSGLGLVISRQLALLLGGDLLVSSVPGEGTRCRVMIDPGTISDIPLERYQPASSAVQSAAGSEECPDYDATPLEARVLLAEDCPDNQRLIGFVLQRAGAEVMIVDNGQQAVTAALQAQAGERRFDLLIMDMQMPVMDGYTAVAELRSHGYEGKIVALTAHAMVGDRRKCLDAGCDDYLAKPINREQLLKMVFAAASTTHEEPRLARAD